VEEAAVQTVFETGLYVEAGVPRRFWPFVVPLPVGFSAAGLLLLSVFSGRSLRRQQHGPPLTALLAVAALGGVARQSIVVCVPAVGGIDHTDPP